MQMFNQNNITRKATLPGRQHYQEGSVARKATLPGRQHCQEGNIARKATLPGRQHCQEGNIARKATLPGRRAHFIYGRKDRRINFHRNKFETSDLPSGTYYMRAYQHCMTSTSPALVFLVSLDIAMGATRPHPSITR